MLVGILTLSSNTTFYKHFHLKYNTASMQCSGLWVNILTCYCLQTYSTMLLQCSGCIVSWYSDLLLTVYKHYDLNHNTTSMQFNVLLVDILITPRWHRLSDTYLHHHTGFKSLTAALHCCSVFINIITWTSTLPQCNKCTVDFLRTPSTVHFLTIKQKM